MTAVLLVMANNSYIFSTLEKFTDGNTTELTNFLSKFDRCCIVANKVDADGSPVKGQLLMLFVEGRARAVLEEFELSQGGAQQTYTALVAKLREHFDNTTTQESSMILFENRVKKATESEEEFMLDLAKLYKAANPQQAAEVVLLAVKRKFLAGIAPNLRNNIFVFCADPYANAVSRETLLGHCRKAKNLLSHAEEPTQERSTDRVLPVTDQVPSPPSQLDGLVAAMSTLATTMQEHVRSTDQRLSEFSDTVSAMGQRGGRGGFRGRTRGGRGGGNWNNNPQRGSGGGNRGNRGNRGGGGSRGGSNAPRGGRGGNNRMTCWNCGEPNHMSQNCLAPPGNF